MTTPYVAAPPRRVWMSTVSAVLSGVAVVGCVAAPLLLLMLTTTSVGPPGATFLAPSPAEVALSILLVASPNLLLALPALVLAVLSPWWTRLEKVLVVLAPWAAGIAGMACVRLGMEVSQLLGVLLLLSVTLGVGVLLLVLARRAQRRAHA